jgi:nitric-oxide synthase
VDLLPKGAVAEDVRQWLETMALAKQLNVIHTCTVSSKTKGGIAEAGAYLRQNRLGRDIYIMGAANVGKSAFSR